MTEIGSLPTDPSERREEVISLHDKLGLTFVEIARRVGLSSSRVAQLYHKGIQNGRKESDPVFCNGLDKHIVESLLAYGVNNIDEAFAADLDDLLRFMLRWPNIGRLKLNRFRQFLIDQLYLCEFIDFRSSSRPDQTSSSAEIFYTM